MLVGCAGVGVVEGREDLFALIRGVDAERHIGKGSRQSGAHRGGFRRTTRSMTCVELGTAAGSVRRRRGRRRRSRSRLRWGTAEKKSIRARRCSSGQRSAYEGSERQQLAVPGGPQSVVDVGESADPFESSPREAAHWASEGRRLVGAGSRTVGRGAGCQAARCRTRRGRPGDRGRRRSGVLRSSTSSGWRPACEVLEDQRLGLSIHDDLAAGRQEREPSFDLALKAPTSLAGQRAQLYVEAELLALVSDEVEDGQNGLVGRATKSATELLQEDRWRSRWGGGTAPCRRRAGRGPR